MNESVSETGHAAFKIRNPVKVPSNVDNDECSDDLEYMEAAGPGPEMKESVQFLKDGLRQVAESDDDAIVKPPEDVMDLRSVPQTDDEEDKNIGNAGGKNTSGVPSEVFRAPFPKTLHWLQEGEWVENIVTHECAEADMPAAPEIAERNTEVRLAEIGHELNAEDSGDAGDDIDAAGEIRILLGGVKQDPKHDDASRKRIHRAVEECGNVVREHI